MLKRRAIIAAAAALPFAARAQARYPSQPVRIIVPFGPGGLADVTARAVAEALSERLGQQFIVVNQPGPGGTAAARAVLAAPPDGYTLALFTNGTAISVPLVQNLGFDPLAQFVPVSSLGFFDFLFLANSAGKFASLKDFLDAAKARPSALNIGTIAAGSSQNLSAVLFKSMAGVEAAVIPFRTTPDALTALLRQDIDLMIDGYAAAKAMLEEGKVRALAVSGSSRFAGLPDVPPAGESVPGFDVTSWNALFALAGTPPDIVKTLNEAVNAALSSEVLKRRLLALGIEARGGAPEAISARLKSDIAKWGDVIQRAGIQRQ